MIYPQFKNNLLQLFADKKYLKRLVLAYSGGLDSTVLLDLLARLVSENVLDEEVKILVVHVNHKIHRDADKWQTHCQQITESYGFEFCAYAVDGLLKEDFSKRENLEKNAREARYQIFQSVSKADDLFLLAHHQDDQAETVLFNLFKGHGQSALSGIPQSRLLNKADTESALLFRPLLDLNKTLLQDYAINKKLKWVEDDSNSDEHFSRNFIRQQIIPKIKQQWPEVLTNISRSATFLAENQILINTLAENDLAACACVDDNLKRWGACISLDVFEKLDRVRQKHVLRFWLDRKHIMMPSHKVLDELLDLSAHGLESNMLVCWKQDEFLINFRYFEKHLFLEVSNPAENMAENSLSWDLLKDTVFKIKQRRFSAVLHSTALAKRALLKPSVKVLEVRFRQGGERCKPSERQHSQSLKKLLQEYRVPPWERDGLPLFYYQNDLVAVADLWVCADYQARDEQGWLLAAEPV